MASEYPADWVKTDETMMTIHFDADLRAVLGEHVGMLHWVIDPEVSGFIIGYDLSDNQVLICNFDVSIRTVWLYPLLIPFSQRDILWKAGTRILVVGL